ncbi:hypothetical protein B0H21DRAFT_688764 [Amylocystis lapponica]|nr:hypothetical protein B0H21DRAFT_688764 [Amylocystis lapponica]
MQNGTIAPRESTPSPSFRERQRAAKAHSMPIVPSVYANQGQQSSPTTSNPTSRRTPPPTSRISPVSVKMSGTSQGRDRSPELTTPPPPLVHSHSQPIVPHLIPLPPPAPQHTQSSPNVMAHHPRPIPRVAPPQFLTQYQMQDEKWQMTEELMAEIERADQQQAQSQFSHPAGTSGVAYAGGAASSGVSIHMQHTPAAAVKDPTIERVRVSDRASPKDQESSGSQTTKRPLRESPKSRDRAQTVGSLPSAHDSSGRTPEYRGSPQYSTPLASPGERTAAYAQYVPDGYSPGNPQGAAPPALRKTSAGTGAPSADPSSTRLTPPASTKLASHTPPLQSMATRPPDRSLPVQEEPEEDVAHDFVDHEPDYDEHRHGSPTPSSDVYPEGHVPRYSGSTAHGEEDEDDETLNEEADEHLQQSKSSEESEAGFTPRSPSTNLPERPPQYAVVNIQYGPPNVQYAQPNGEYQKTIRPKGRSGSTDQLGMRTFDPTMFGQTVNSLRGNAQDVPVNVQRHQSMPLPLPQPLPQPQSQVQSQLQPQTESPRQQNEAPRQYASNPIAEQTSYARIHPAQISHPDDLRGLFDDPTSSYLKAYLQSPDSRPGAPVPPTPHSQTAAPSPSPLISAMQSDAEPRQVGSPYPYPFTHIRRSTGSAPQQAPSTAYDMNNPAVIREQLALQMQIYALNNGLPPPSDSTFSPSSTPYPGPGYNPWAFMPMMSAPSGMGGADGATMSMRSSPSHEPVQLPPPPPMRGRGLRRRDQPASLRGQQGGAHVLRRVKPPPRVESTQPRETSPEPSSGEETAGEERFVDRYAEEASEPGGWVPGAENGSANGHANGNGNGNGNGVLLHADEEEGEWVDEEEEGEEEDLLELEFHPTFVSNVQKRRRRWMTRWDTLTQAFQALDRETDATLVLLASPSHSTKLHALTSRCIRRDPSLANSPKLASMRGAFNHLATQRRAERSHRISLVDRLQISSRSASSIDGSPAGGEMREEDLRRALETALGSLGAMGKIYEQREARWRDEMRQLSEDRDRVELLLRQTLGPTRVNGHDGGREV